MNENLNQDSIRKIKNEALESNFINTAKIQKNIVESWLKSKEFGLNPHIKTIPKTSNNPYTLKNITAYKQYTWSNFDSFFSPLHNHLNKLGIAILYLDYNLSVFNKGGNEELLAELKKKNIKFSTSFSEQFMGTNAAALCLKLSPHEVATVTGEEHYVDALCDYVTISRYFIYEDDKSYNFQCFIVPLSLYTEKMHSEINFMFNAINLFISSSPNDIILKEMMNLNFQQSEAVQIFIDEQGIIVKINNSFEKVFNTNISHIGGKNIKDVVPELSLALTCIKTKEKISLKEIIFHSFDLKQNSFLMDCVPLLKNNSCIGLIITLTHKKHFNKFLKSQLNQSTYYTFSNLIGENINFLHVKQLAETSSKSPSNILIIGESGTGKELFAQAIHSSSKRSTKPFVAINCAAIPRELIGAELFGYVEGAFTGAKKSGAPGKFELADKGTLFLDEIAEMPLDMQSMLLRVLEEKQVTRLGDSQSVDVDVRIIAATNKNLWDMVNKKTFRLDLYFRLNVIKLDIPPLRERVDDIPILAKHMIKELSNNFGKKVNNISPEILNLFSKYSWPGNIRELRNVLERCINITPDSEDTIKDVPLEIFNVNPNKSALDFNSKEIVIQNKPVKQSYEQYETERIQELMIKYNGNKSAVANEMGIARKTLYNKLKKIYGS